MSFDDEEAQEEQAAELEAVAAIFDTDFQLLDAATDTPRDLGARFAVTLIDEDVARMNGGESVEVRLEFTHERTYPGTPVLVAVQAVQGMSPAMRKRVQKEAVKVAKECVDAVAVFTICDAVRDWIVANASRLLSNNVPDDDEGGETVGGQVAGGRGGGGGLEDDEDDGSKFETLDVTQQDKVEVISSKAIGTPVTEESFAQWQEAFLADIRAARSKEEVERDAVKLKMTGREYFESRTVVVSAESESFWEAEAEADDS